MLSKNVEEIENQRYNLKLSAYFSIEKLSIQFYNRYELSVFILIMENV